METNLGTLDKLKKRDVVMSIKYVRLVRFFLSTLRAWPQQELCEDTSKISLYMSRCYGYYLTAQEVMLTYGCAYYIFVNELDMLALGHAVSSSMLTFLTTVRLLFLCLKGYRKITEDFLMNFHLVYFKHKGPHFEEVFKIIEKVSYYLAVYTCFTMLFGCTMFNMIPFYNNYKRGAFSKDPPANITYDFGKFFAFPFFEPSKYFKTVSVANFYFAYNCAVAVCVVDLLISLMVFHIIGHIMILRKSLERLEEPQKSRNTEGSHDHKSYEIRRYAEKYTYSELENKNIAVFIEDFVKYHRMIVSFTDRLSRFFGPVLALNYVFHLVTLCMLLLECSEGTLTALIRFGPLTLILFGQLIQISVIFEVIATVSEKLPDALYCIPWECLDISNQRTVCILLHRLQRPIHVTALGMTSVGVTTMAGILKTTFSYFAFLRSLNE